MNTIIIYRSFLGTSKQYAEWLSCEIGAKTYSHKQVKKSDIENADSVVFVGGTYAGWISLTNFINAKWPLLKNKMVIFANVGMAPESDPQTIKAWKKLPKEIIKIKVPGRMGKTGQEKVQKQNLDSIIELIKKR